MLGEEFSPVLTYLECAVGAMCNIYLVFIQAILYHLINSVIV